MTWQGSGTGAPGEPDDDATRTDIPVPGQPAPPPFTPPADDTATAPVPEPPSPFAPGGPLADDAALGAAGDPSAGGAPLPPPAGPPDAPPAGLPPAPGATDAGAMGGAGRRQRGMGDRPAGQRPVRRPGCARAWSTQARCPASSRTSSTSILIAIVATIVTMPFARADAHRVARRGGARLPAAWPMTPTVAASAPSSSWSIEAAYFSLLWASGGRATLGMRLLKLQVGDATTGNRIPIATAFRRWLAFGAWVQLIGFVPVLGGFAGLAVFAWQLILLVDHGLASRRRWASTTGSRTPRWCDPRTPGSRPASSSAAS